MHELDLSRHAPVLDPAFHVWGWEVPVYLFLGGLAAGAMIWVPLLLARGSGSRTLRRLAFAAPILVSVGMLALFLDLEHKLHAWRFYLAFRWTSPMSWGAWILVLVYPVSLLLALGALDDEDAAALARRAGPLGGLLGRARANALARTRCLTRASVAIGAGLGVYTGILLSALAARPLWGSAVLGPLFLASGASAGAAFLLLFRLADEERHWLVKADLAAMGLEAVLLLLFAIGHATGDSAGQTALTLLTRGPYAGAFWGLVVAGGLALPALLEALEHKVKAAAALAPAKTKAGGLALRWIIVAAGQR
jgi:protein NrfD